MHEVESAMRTSGYAFVSGSRFGTDLVASTAWTDLTLAFHRLPVDRYLKNDATFRERRYGRFSLSHDGDLVDEPLAPYFQASEFNKYAGGIDRVYEDLEPEIRRNQALKYLISTDAELFGICYPTVKSWRVDVHLFRVLAKDGEEGLPSPEGLHRDGNDAFAVHLVKRRCRGGTSRVYSTERELLEEKDLEAGLDTLYVNDNMVLHEVSPVLPQDGEVGFRDVMIIDFYRVP
jgi:hypothetical protein